MTVRSVLLPPRAARLAVLPLAWACLGHGQEPSQAGPPIVLARMDRCTPSSALAR